MRSKIGRPVVAFGRRFPTTSLVILISLAALGFGYASLRPAVSDLAVSPTPSLAGAVPPLGPPAGDVEGGVPASPPDKATSAATAAANGPSDIRRRIADAEGALRTGQITATDDLSGGIRITTTLRFDLGDESRAPSIHVIGVYQGDAASQSLERIVIGDLVWQRQIDGGWRTVEAQGGTLDQVRAFLPHVDAAPLEIFVETTGQMVTLRWYDAARDIEVAVEADPATGVPRRATERIRATGALLTVVYDAWNTDITVTPPNTAVLVR